MLSDFMDYKNSIAKKLFHLDKIDPGSFSFLESGWWALHLTAISGAVWLGYSMAKESMNNEQEH